MAKKKELIEKFRNEVEIIKKTKDTRNTPGHPNMCFVRLDRESALRLVRSIVHQMEDNNPNTYREEFNMENGWYFTVVVKPEEIQKNNLSIEMQESIKRIMKKNGWIIKGDDV